MAGIPHAGAGSPVFATDASGAGTTLRPPGSGHQPPEKDRWRGWVWILLGIAVSTAILVAIVLPGVVQDLSVANSQSVTEAQTAVTSVPPVANPIDAAPAVIESGDASGGAGENAEREAATQALQDYLRMRASPQLTRAEQWGEPQWSEAETAAAAGESHLRGERFAQAAGAYHQAAQALKVLLAQRPERLLEHLTEAAGALRRNDAEAAVDGYQRVLAMEAGQKEAARGLARAQARDEVLRHMAAGQRFENEAELDDALRAYQAALDLDADFEPAGEALRRIRDDIDTRQFQEAMSRGLAALDAGDLEEAGAALAVARRLRPGAPALRDASQRLAGARQRARLAALRSQAVALAAAENWPDAAARYQQALTVDSNASFARRGLSLARARQELHRTLDHYLGAPERLGSPEPLANAEQLLAAAGAAGIDEPRLAAKLAALRTQVDLYRAPVTVTLRSDGQTEVTIFHVGRLGRFQEKRLDLRPGKHTITGSRLGYRDVRRVLNLRPGAAPEPLVIVCEEAI